MIGLGRMGGNMVLRLLRGGHRVVAYDPFAEAVQKVVKEGATGVASIKELVSRLNKPRAVWMMVPAGAFPLAPGAAFWRAIACRAEE